MRFHQFPKPFQKGIHQLTIIHTDLVEAEGLIKGLSAVEAKANPELFKGKTPCVYFKLPYIPPFERFEELQRLILCVRESTGLRAYYKGIVAIEATEWIGHEREEYFTVILKYLYDHRDIWRPALILNNCNEGQLSKLCQACSLYLTPRLFNLCVFLDLDTLSSYLSALFRARELNVSDTAITRLATALLKSEYKPARSITLLERVVDEILTLTDKDDKITEHLIDVYLDNPYSTLTMLSGTVAHIQRSTSYENETVQLRG